MSKLLYFLTVFAESGLSVFGIRSSYEQPPYAVQRAIADDMEIRLYGKRVAVETSLGAAGDGEAFGRLFRYIAGANQGHQLVSMTAPVAQSPEVMVQTQPSAIRQPSDAGPAVMRFFLPADIARGGAPVPTEAGVRIVDLPPVTLGVVRFSGTATAPAIALQTGRLRHALSAAGLKAIGAATLFTYDPPFTIPPLRRNEIAVPIAD